jgi:ABC-type transport system involved in multi-copper enzyme maturation permease subunit
MPWGGILASAFATLVTVLVTLLLLSLVGPVFEDIYEAMTYGYMGVAWSFFNTLFFGIGQEKPYLWAGQKTAGTWDDVDEYSTEKQPSAVSG